MILAQAFARFVFDLDGVIWRGAHPIPGAPETIRALRDAGRRVCFVTNNSSATHHAYAEKLAAFGAGGSADEVISSADATARLLTRTVDGLRGRAAFVVGGDGLRSAMAGVGLRIVEGEEALDASLVVVGWDRELTYEKIRLASLAIQRGAAFYASNRDASYPAPDGNWPGAGAIVAAIRTATGVEPIVAGKPEPTMLEVAAEVLGGSPALVVGDRLDTDIAAARAIGWPSALVLTGVTGVPELAMGDFWPDIVLRRVSELLDDRPGAEIRPATGPDLPHIANLLHEGGLISGAARERLGRTVVAEADRRPIATAAWEQVDDAALLRSVAVDATVRGRGTGMLVVAAALRQIVQGGARDVYLVTADQEPFFTRCGFRTVERASVPAAVSMHPQVARECSPSAPIMHLRLRRA